VELNHEQAILSVCSTMATTIMAGALQNCRSGACKISGSGGAGADNAGRAS